MTKQSVAGPGGYLVKDFADGWYWTPNAALEHASGAPVWSVGAGRYETDPPAIVIPVEDPGATVDARRTMDGETVGGFKVAAWRYIGPQDPDDARYGYRYCEHWSSVGNVPKKVERLFTEEQLCAAMLSAAPAPEGGAVKRACADFQDAIGDFEADVADVMADGSERADLWDREVTVNIDALKAVMNAALATRVEAQAEAREQWLWRVPGRGWVLCDREDDVVREVRVEGEYVETEVVALSALRAQPPAREGAQPVAWHPVVGFEGHYEVSALGDVRNVKTGRTQAKNTMGRGYIKAEFWKDGERTQTSVHRVVAEAFLPRRDGLNEVNHIDGDKTNNAAWNLEWTDRKGNTDHSRYVLGNDVKPVLATDPETGAQEYFPSIEDAGRSGYNASGIYDALNGRKRTHGGKAWSFTEWRGPQPTHPAPDALRTAVEAGGLKNRTVLQDELDRLSDQFTDLYGVAEKLREALDPFARIASEGVIRTDEGHVTVTTCAEYFHAAVKAHAALQAEQKGGAA